MKLIDTPTLLLSLVATSLAYTIPTLKDAQRVLTEEIFPSRELRYIETGPGQVLRVTERRKWQLKREGINLMDVTDTEQSTFGTSSAMPASINDVSSTAPVTYPKKPFQNDTLRPMLKHLDKSNMHSNLEKFTSFYTRYYQSSYGQQSSKWLLEQVNHTLTNSTASKYGATATAFEHPWGQSSVIARIPGKSNRTIVIGAHQDSINLFLPSILSAPGADDDGSGTVTILEALRVLLQSEKVVKGEAENTIEFQWYSAEEGGLLGSQAVFSAYAKERRDVEAMLQQDMTGYIHNTIKAGKVESVGVITDFVDTDLTEFIKMIITEYCDIPYTLTKCGYACSDHASASKAGYPSAFVIESDFEYSDKKIHTSDDKLEYLSFDHMLQHARLTLSFAFELAFASFD